MQNKPFETWRQMAAAPPGSTPNPGASPTPTQDTYGTMAHEFISPVKHGENLADALRNPVDRLKDPAEVFLGPLATPLAGLLGL
jgi:hypothetical protein